jgi:hypothetical protein
MDDGGDGWDGEERGCLGWGWDWDGWWNVLSGFLEVVGLIIPLP